MSKQLSKIMDIKKGYFDPSWLVRNTFWPSFANISNTASGSSTSTK